MWFFYYITLWILLGVIFHYYLLVIDPLFDILKRGGLFSTKIKVRDSQKEHVLAFILLIIVKEILWYFNQLVSFSLWIINCDTQLMLSGCQDFEQRIWVCFIFYLTLWILAGINSHKYLLVLDPEFWILKRGGLVSTQIKRGGCFLTKHSLINMNQLIMKRGRT